MSPILRAFITLLALAGWAAADLPRKAPLTKYRSLWQNSPFTSKPPPDVGVPEANILEDYALAGVSPIDGGYRVTVINKKKPDERIYVYSDEPDAKHGFRIDTVERKEGGPRATVVHMTANGQRGTVSYDEALLTIAAPAQKPPVQDRGNRVLRPGGVPVNNPAPNANPAGAAGAAGAAAQQNQPQGAPRAPRPRVIGPPPTPQARPIESNERPIRR